MQQDGLMWGFQLWVNLPAKDKMTEPRYQDIAADRSPTVETASGARVRVVAGEVEGVAGPSRGHRDSACVRGHRGTGKL